MWEKKPCILNALQESKMPALFTGHSLPCLSEIAPRASGVSNCYTAALALMRMNTQPA